MIESQEASATTPSLPSMQQPPILPSILTPPPSSSSSSALTLGRVITNPAQAILHLVSSTANWGVATTVHNVYFTARTISGILRRLESFYSASAKKDSSLSDNAATERANTIHPLPVIDKEGICGERLELKEGYVEFNYEDIDFESESENDEVEDESESENDEVEDESEGEGEIESEIDESDEGEDSGKVDEEDSGKVDEEDSGKVADTGKVGTTTVEKVNQIKKEHSRVDSLIAIIIASIFGAFAILLLTYALVIHRRNKEFFPAKPAFLSSPDLTDITTSATIQVPKPICL